MQGKNRAVNSEYKQIKSKYEISDNTIDTLYNSMINFKPEIILNARIVQESEESIEEIYGTINLNKNNNNYINNININTIKYGWLYSQNNISKNDLLNNKSNEITDWHYLQKTNDQLYNIIKREESGELNSGYYYLCLMINNMEFWQVCDLKPYTITLNNQGATDAGTAQIYEIYNFKYSLSLNGNSMAPNKNNITPPTKNGLYFCGYYTATNGGGVKYIDSNGYLTSSADNKHFTSNGTLYAYWKTLPEEYQQVQYIATDGTESYIDTKFTPNQDTRVVMDFQVSQNCDGVGFTLFGGRQSTLLNGFSFQKTSTNKWGSMYNETLWLLGPSYDTDRHIVDKNKTLYI